MFVVVPDVGVNFPANFERGTPLHTFVLPPNILTKNKKVAILHLYQTE